MSSFGGKRLSYSSINTFKSCPKKFHWSYVRGIEKREKRTRYAAILGSAVHEGMADWLVTGRYDVGAWVDQNTEADKMVFDWEVNHDVPDTDYYLMMDEIRLTANRILEYQTARFPSNYRVAYSGEFMGGELNQPLVEYEIEFELEEHKYVGYVDAILYDSNTDTFVPVDFKVRGQFAAPHIRELDTQLPLYAMVLQQIALKPINRALSYEMRNSVPKEVVINKDGTPSIAAIASTWEAWSLSCRKLGIDPDKYADKIKHKLHDEAWYTLTSDIVINDDLLSSVWSEVQDWSDVVASAEKFPGVYNHMTCQMCPFHKLCHTERYGGDVGVIIERDFVEKWVLTDDAE